MKPITQRMRTQRREQADKRNATFTALPLEEKIRRNPNKADHYRQLHTASKANG